MVVFHAVIRPWVYVYITGKISRRIFYYSTVIFDPNIFNIMIWLPLFHPANKLQDGILPVADAYYVGVLKGFLGSDSGMYAAPYDRGL